MCITRVVLGRAIQAVREVYAAHAPEKLSQVDTILLRWAGREQALLMRLHKKCEQLHVHSSITILPVAGQHISRTTELSSDHTPAV